MAKEAPLSEEEARRRRRKDRRQYIILIASGTFLTPLLMNGTGIFETWLIFGATMLWSLTIWLTQSLGGGYLVDRLEEKWPWVDQPRKRLVIQLITLAVYSSLAIIVVNFAFYRWYFGEFPKSTLNYAFTCAMSGMAITILVAFPMTAAGFLQGWRKSIKREEEMRAQMLSYQYEALRAQVNPHFLFNSLNVLSSLVYEDQAMAVKFIRQLGDVYRYVLDRKDSEVVTLKEELAFFEQFRSLLMIRFEKGLDVRVEAQAHDDKYVIPMGLQLLLENAVKHNATTAGSPLVVTVKEEGGYLVVSNNLQLREGDPRVGGLGLENIKQRYAPLTDQPVRIEHNAENFTVSLPLLEIENNQSS